VSTPSAPGAENPTSVEPTVVAELAHRTALLGCVAGITNGPVRDVPEMERIDFQTFAGGAGVGGCSTRAGPRTSARSGWPARWTTGSPAARGQPCDH